MMSAITLEQLNEAMPVSKVKRVVSNAVFNRVSTDTRSIEAGDLFVALRGEHFNGNEFVANALDQGAVAALVDQAPCVDMPYLMVADTREALGVVARCNRRRFKGKLIALTGSAGKTTVKEMLAAIFSEEAPTLATEGNLNNEIGVPQTLLKISPEHHFAVIEMGAAKVGDIAYLCQFAEPDITLLTNAMSAHIEGFGSLENVAKTKGEIFDYTAKSGSAVINWDSPFKEQWLERAKESQVKTFSLNNNRADVYAKNIELIAGKGTGFTLCCEQGEENIQLLLLGRHNVSNALAASAVAIASGISLEKIRLGLEKLKPVAGRMQCLSSKKGTTVIDDSYNANPGAVKAAIDVLAEYSGKRCLVLGVMAELGSTAAAMHNEVGAYAKEKQIEQLIAIGEYAQDVASGFGQQGKAFANIEQLLDSLEEVEKSDVVLVKGSRSARMERVVDALCIKTKNRGGADAGLAG